MARHAAIGVYAFLCAVAIFLLTRLGAPGPGGRPAGGGGEDDAGRPQPVERSAAWVTLTTDDRYVLGAAVLAQSIADSGSAIAHRVCLVTPRVTAGARAALGEAGWGVREVAPLSSPRLREGFTRYADTYTKLRVWALAEFRTVIYLDADVLVLRNADRLVHSPLPSPRHIAAADDCCDLFNPGVLVLRPDAAVHADMVARIADTPSYDGGDGGFLNEYFPRATAVFRLSFRYNADQITLAIPRNRIAYRLEDVRVIHFAGPKPWNALLGGGGGGNGSAAAQQQRREVDGIGLDVFAPLHELWLRSYGALAARLGAAYTRRVLAMAEG